MDAAANAVNKLLYGARPSQDNPSSQGDQGSQNTDINELTSPHRNNTGGENTTVSEEVAPAVEHETVNKKHEIQEQTVVDKEIHQDHYHTTVQPIKDREVLPTEHEHEQADTQYRTVEHEGGEDVEGNVRARRQEFQDTSREGAAQEWTTSQPTVTGENVHHHLHETVQPVIEKETVQPSVTHKTIPVKETHHQVSKDHGTTTNAAISKDEFQRRLDGEDASEKDVFDGTPSEAKPPTV